MTVLAYRFSCYTLLPAGWADLELARLWTSQDPDHAGQVQPDFWIEQGQGIESWLLTDKDGPVFFFKAIVRDRDLEVHIQFPPYPQLAPIAEQHRHRRRMSMALIEGMRWLEQRVYGVFRVIRFDSRNSSLIHFAERHLGFVNQEGQLSKRLQTNGGD